MIDGDVTDEDSQVKDATERQHDMAYSNMKCLEFVFNHFVNNKNERIFQRIEGPYNNMFEVTCNIKQRDNVEKIETQFLKVLASRMTELAQDECFTSKLSLTSASTIPKSTQGYTRRRATEFSMHPHSEMSYVNAALGGRKNLGLKHDLVTVTTLSNHVQNNTPVSSQQASTESINLAKTIEELAASQLAHQQKCDEQFLHFNETVRELRTETQQVKQQAEDMTIAVSTTHRDLLTTITKTQQESETRITMQFQQQMKIQTDQTTETNQLIKQLVGTINGN